MEEKPLVSVIIPAYNTKRYIDSCLKSVIKQTYSNLEIIVVDDGSTDCLYKIVERYIIFDKRIKLIRQENKGASGARNSAIKKVSGEYIFFVDSDDWLDLNAIELLVKKAIDEESDAVMPDRYIEISEDNEKTEEMLFINYDKFKTVDDFVMNIIIGQGRAWRVSSVLYKTSIVKNHEIKFPEGYTAEDIVFNLKFLSRANKLSFISFPTLNVNKRHDSVTATYNDNLFNTYLFIDDKVKEYIYTNNIDKAQGDIAINSLLTRNIILLLSNKISNNNKIQFKEKVDQIYLILNTKRVKEAFKQKKLINPYWDSKIKVYYIIIMRFLIRYKLYTISIFLAILSKKF